MGDIKLLNSRNSAANFLKHNVVVILFVVLTLAGAAVSGLQPHFIVNELVARVGRNAFFVIALIIPIIAGVGLNFGIVVGAMAGQTALIIATYFGCTGPLGLFIAFIVATPIAIFLGYLTGGLFNRTKGQEMISGLIVGFFADGLYQFIFLFLVGAVIPIKDTPMLKPDGIGLRNTISLGTKHGEGLKYALDYIVRVNLWHLLIVGAIAAIIISLIISLIKKRKISVMKFIPNAALIIVSLIAMFAPGLGFVSNVKAPLITLTVIACLCLFTKFIFRTKLGQDFRAIGQNQHIAGVAGIHVDKTRMVAVILSTVFASWGQIIFLQNMGTINTYGSHKQVGLLACAAILIGGASIKKATIGQALVGTILLHSIFIVSPNAGIAIFGDQQIGEFFRSGVVYGVIGVSLVLYAWKVVSKKKRELEEDV